MCYWPYIFEKYLWLPGYLHFCENGKIGEQTLRKPKSSHFTRIVIENLLIFADFILIFTECTKNQEFSGTCLHLCHSWNQLIIDVDFWITKHSSSCIVICCLYLIWLHMIWKFYPSLNGEMSSSMLKKLELP